LLSKKKKSFIYIRCIFIHQRCIDMLTMNESKVLRLLFAAIDEDYSINEIARKCGLAPNGAAKILKKLEKEGILRAKSIANIKSYRIDFENQKTPAVLELSMIAEAEGRLKNRIEDLKELRETAKACIAFGSYINPNKEPKDLDLLFILDKKDYKQYKKKTDNLRHILPVKLHDITQTEEDMESNIRKKDRIIIEALGTGIMLWGQKTIIELMQKCQKQSWANASRKEEEAENATKD